MAIQVADNFSYQGKKPLDGRTEYGTIAAMVAVSESILNDGCLAYVKENKKYYTFDSNNTIDSTLGKWREFESGSTITVDPTPTSGSTNAVQSGGTYTALEGKVDKVTGKQLSTEDFTTAEKTKLDGINLSNYIPTSQKGANSGVAELDANGKVPSTQLPSYVDDVVSKATKSEFPNPGEDDKIYIAKDENASYRWDGTEYVSISSANGLTLGETSSTAYRGDRGKTAYDDSQTNKTNIGTLSSLTTTDKTSLVSAINEVNASVSDIEDVVPSTATTSNKLATMADVGGASGHTIEDSTGVDMTARANLQFVGATVSDDSTNNRTIVTVDTSNKADKVSGAINGNLASLDNNGNLADSGSKASDFATTSDLDEKEDAFRLSTMPVASADYANGKSYQYIGTTTSTYTHNYFYECKAQGTDPETYAWETVDVQEGSGGDLRIGKGVNKIDVRLEEDGTLRPYIITSYRNLIPSFASASANQIKQIVDMYYGDTLSLADIQDAWKVGDITTFTLDNMTSGSFVASQAGGDYDFVILDFDHDILTTAYEGKTKPLMTLALKTHLPTATGMTHKQGDSGDYTNAGWSVSEMRTFCNNVVKNALPEGMKEMVKSVTKVTGNNSRYGLQTTQDSIFIPTQAEFTGSGASGQGSVYEYYKTASNRNHGATVWTSSCENEPWMAINTSGNVVTNIYGHYASAYMMFAFCI